MGREIHPTNWQLSDEMQKALGERLTFSHGFQAQPFPDLLYALAREAVNDNYEHYLQGLRQETKTICLRKYRLVALKHSISSF